jgi:hypothetical protein
MLAHHKTNLERSGDRVFGMLVSAITAQPPASAFKGMFKART